MSSIAATVRGNPAPIVPGPAGAHSWQPMSYSPVTGLVYLPVNDAGFKYKVPDSFQEKKLAPNYGIDVVAAGMPQDPQIKKSILGTVKGKLVAWDPIQQKAVWTIERPGPWNGGTLVTAGNLAFEGTAGGNFEAYRADNGEKLWSFTAQTGVMAGPITYEVNGEQYVAVLAGWGAVFPLAAGEVTFASGRVRNVSRMGQAAALGTHRATAHVATAESGKCGHHSDRRATISKILCRVSRRCRREWRRAAGFAVQQRTHRRYVVCGCPKGRIAVQGWLHSPASFRAIMQPRSAPT